MGKGVGAVVVCDCVIPPVTLTSATIRYTFWFPRIAERHCEKQPMNRRDIWWWGSDDGNRRRQQRRRDIDDDDDVTDHKLLQRGRSRTGGGGCGLVL